MDARLRELVLLLPDLAQKMPVMQVKAVALMAADTQALATKLLALRRIFPTASVSQVQFDASEVHHMPLCAPSHLIGRRPPSASDLLPVAS